MAKKCCEIFAQNIKNIGMLTITQTRKNLSKTRYAHDPYGKTIVNYCLRVIMLEVRVGFFFVRYPVTIDSIVKVGDSIIVSEYDGYDIGTVISRHIMLMHMFGFPGEIYPRRVRNLNIGHLRMSMALPRLEARFMEVIKREFARLFPHIHVGGIRLRLDGMKITIAVERPKNPARFRSIIPILYKVLGRRVEMIYLDQIWLPSKLETLPLSEANSPSGLSSSSRSNS